jgi:hypothetical protein
LGELGMVALYALGAPYVLDAHFPARQSAMEALPNPTGRQQQ